MDRISVQTNVLKANLEVAMENRRLFEAEGTVVINLMSAPGAGKTSLLEATIQGLRDRYRLAVIEGDLQTDLDSQRIRALDTRSHQITTGTVCHLDARMVSRALAQFPVQGLDLLVIENVGNLICPASYDLGESLRVVICSVADGAEKPKKYPVMFHKADVVILNKTDLATASGVDLRELETNVREVNPKATVFAVSCKTGAGLDAWLAWLRDAIARRSVAAATRT
ncbi:MAG TPA: hydrogenase nickel incorporation protein HypB [Silvibacterium sp.]|jgi:hydrogenase nickel incorporation protein HypB|nr:hydrogenase nickel incorporation protein HypB [Silvibacterium sp.]